MDDTESVFECVLSHLWCTTMLSRWADHEVKDDFGEWILHQQIWQNMYLSMYRWKFKICLKYAEIFWFDAHNNVCRSWVVI